MAKKLGMEYRYLLYKDKFYVTFWVIATRYFEDHLKAYDRNNIKIIEIDVYVYNLLKSLSTLSGKNKYNETWCGIR